MHTSPQQHRLFEVMRPRTHRSLSHSDIAQLTDILAHAPVFSTKHSTTFQTYQKRTHTLIAQLPSHLRSSVPCLSASDSCRLHRRLNLLPVITLYEAIKDKVNQELSAIWHPLRHHGLLDQRQNSMILLVENVSALWLDSDVFFSTFGRSPDLRYSDHDTKCPACKLARIGGDTELCQALGASMLGSMNIRVWERSKRIK